MYRRKWDPTRKGAESDLLRTAVGTTVLRKPEVRRSLREIDVPGVRERSTFITGADTAPGPAEALEEVAAAEG